MSESSRLLVLPYSIHLKSFQHTLLHRFNTRLVFQYKNKLSNILIHNSPTDPTRSGGVYIVPCHDCNSCYIGETIKTLKTRLDQHRYDIRTCNTNNAIFKHILDHNHSIDFDNADFVYNSTDKPTLQFIESILISRKQNFNLKSGFYNVPDSIIDYILIKNKSLSQTVKRL